MLFENENGFFSLGKLDNFKMKTISIVEDVSKKNTSVVTVANYYNKLNSKSFKNNHIYSFEKISYLKFYQILKNERPNLIHIHGMWKFKQIIICILAKIFNIKIIIQPHGMLLEKAIKSGNYFKYLIKILITFFYEFIIKNIYFIAVTNQELACIKVYFKNSKIKIIRNPFRSNYLLSKKIKKNFCFFGRINKHKNLELMILSFIAAKTDKSWKFYIYGIREDEKYFKELKMIIKKFNYEQRIIFKKPVFNENSKFKIMSQSSYNIIMSKSEILNLSVLESLSLGTMVVVNKVIPYPKEISRLIIFSKPDISSLSKKIKKLSQINLINFSNKKKLQKKFLENYNLENIKKEYLHFINKVILEN